MQQNHVDIQEKLKSFGFKKSEIINICRHMTLTFQIQLTRIFTFTCNLLMSTCTCTYTCDSRDKHDGIQLNYLSIPTCNLLNMLTCERKQLT